MVEVRIFLRYLNVLMGPAGINPAACVAMLKTLAKKSGVEFSIAEVTGDDVMSHREELAKLGVTEMFSGGEKLVES